MWGGPTGPLRDLLATTERAIVLLDVTVATVKAARVPVHKDAPQAHHLDIARRQLESAQARLRHVQLVHTLVDVDPEKLVA